MTDRTIQEIEWPTMVMLGLTYALAAGAVFGVAQWSLWLAVPLVALVTAQHSSLTHEMLHGHPTRDPWVNALLVGLPLTLAIPYLRFKDLHLAHHRDEALTDPYDDPESNFLDPAVWARLSWPMQALLRFNNTMAGRMLVGPAIGLWAFVAGDVALIRSGGWRGGARVLLGWGLHLPQAALVVWLVIVSPMPLWAYLLGAYGGLSILKIRTYLEHRTHDKARARTVVVEDRGPLSIIFLNNNFHVVHHMHPRTAWYRLPALYAARRDLYLARNDGYRYRSYAEVFGRYFLTAKDPVPHPTYPLTNGDKTV